MYYAKHHPLALFPTVFFFFSGLTSVLKIPPLKVQVLRESIKLLKNYWTTDLIFLGNRELAFITTVKLIHPRSSLYISPIFARRDKYIHRLYLKKNKSRVRSLHCNFQGVIITPLVGLI